MTFKQFTDSQEIDPEIDSRIGEWEGMEAGDAIDAMAKYLRDRLKDTTTQA